MKQHGVYDKPNLRLMVEGMLHRLRVGCPWRDLPAEFGCWNSIYQKFNRWSSKNKLMNVLTPYSTGAIGKEEQAIGKSRGGNTTKIHMAVDAFGLPIQFEITGGEVHDCKIASEFIEKLPVSDYVIADKGYDSEEVRETVRKKSSIPMIPRKNNSKKGNSDMDWSLYKYRHLVENIFARLKHFRSIATRYDKLKRNYLSMLAMACSYIWLPM
jgi:transposase